MPNDRKKSEGNSSSSKTDIESASSEMISLFKGRRQEKNSCALSTLLVLGNVSRCAQAADIHGEHLEGITQQADEVYERELKTSREAGAGQGFSLKRAIELYHEISIAKSRSATSIAGQGSVSQKVIMSEDVKKELDRHIQHLVNYKATSEDAEKFFERHQLNCYSEPVFKCLEATCADEEKITTLRTLFQKQFEAQKPAMIERPIPASAALLTQCTTEGNPISFDFNPPENEGQLRSYVSASINLLDSSELERYLDHNYDINYLDHLEHMGVTEDAQVVYFEELIKNRKTDSAQSAVAHPMERFIQTLTANPPSSFIVLGGAHYCGVHVFNDKSFAFFNSLTGELSTTKNPDVLRQTLCRSVTNYFSLQPVLYTSVPALQQSLGDNRSTMFASSSPPPPPDHGDVVNQKHKPG